MKSVLLASCCLLLGSLSAFCQSADSILNKAQGKICITIDYLPAEKTYDQSARKQIFAGIIKALGKHNIQATGFVVGEDINEDWGMLDKWLADGNTLGFFPYSNQDINEVPLQSFIDDVEKGKETAEKVLEYHRQKERYFRYPFLRYGGMPEMRQDVQDYLEGEDISVAHVSILTEDFVYNLSLEKNLNSGDTLRFLELKNEYVEHVINCLKKSERLAKEIAGRPVRQIIQLHANRINAMYLSDVLTAIEKRGYRFVSLAEALQDDIYKTVDAYFQEQYVSFLERIKYSNPDYIPAVEK